MNSEIKNVGKDPEKIRNMFSKVAANYDRANSVLSVGIHHLWRKKLVRLSKAQAGMSVLDCATGTGDLAIEFKSVVGTSGRVVGTDFCAEMLEPAPAKSQKAGFQIEWAQADVTALQFESKSFDITSISFGIRNVSDPALALSEMARVTKSGGRVMILEFGQMQWPVISQLYQFYSEKVLPILGGWVTGQQEAYKYLQESSSEFPCREKFLDLMRDSGKFSQCEYFPVSGGIAYIYRAVVN